MAMEISWIYLLNMVIVQFVMLVVDQRVSFATNHYHHKHVINMCLVHVYL